MATRSRCALQRFGTRRDKKPMSDKANGGWIEGWIEQQRELLRQRSAGGDAATAPLAAELKSLGDKWLDVGQSYLQGAAQHARDGKPDAPFKIGEELLHTWHAAWAGSAAGAHGVNEQLAALLAHVPPVGLAREQTQMWRDLVAARVECGKLERELEAVLLRVQADVLTLLERRIREREASQKPIRTYRELYGLWVECGEQVYSQVAHSEAYSKLQAALGNATMQVRAR